MQDVALQQLVAAVKRAGGQVEDKRSDYVRAVFVSGAASDVVEFLFASGDNTVALRAVPRNPSQKDFGRNARRLEQLRRSLGWTDVFILRNRQRFFGVIESPLDGFGPVPPISNDYGAGFDSDS